MVAVRSPLSIRSTRRTSSCFNVSGGSLNEHTEFQLTLVALAILKAKGGICSFGSPSLINPFLHSSKMADTGGACFASAVPMRSVCRS